MPEKSASSGIIQVAIALIGVLGSLGVAYITTGAKFKSEVDEARVKITEAQKDVGELKKSAQDIDAKLTSQQGAVEKRIAELQTQLLAAESKNKEFQDQLASFRTSIESSKQEVNTTATKAIKEINMARIRGTMERPTP
jgi:septal ring factor EnvC (AmiA/AmiB activator)